jgi:hypothetical protein
LGIITLLTGGGKYVPDDMRFQILYRLFFNLCSNWSIDTSSTPAAPRLARTLCHATSTAHFEIQNGLFSVISSSPDASGLTR